MKFHPVIWGAKDSLLWPCIQVTGVVGVRAVHGRVAVSRTSPSPLFLLALVPDDPFDMAAYGAATVGRFRFTASSHQFVPSLTSG